MYKQTRQKKSDVENQKDGKKTEIKELYLLERLHEAIRIDKERGKPSSANRELYLMEKLYDAILNDKKRNSRLNQN